MATADMPTTDMATTDKATLLGWIVTRWKPTVAQFKAFAESYWHKDEKIPTSSIDGLDSIMNGVATEEYVSNSIVAYGEGMSTIINELNAKVGIVGKTHAEMSTMIAEGALTPGILYKITDRGDRGIILRATGASQLSPDGIRIMLCPATYSIGADAHGNSWIGVWHSTKTATFNCLAIWGGHVWRNLTGNIGSSIDVGNLDNANWQLVEKDTFERQEYIEMAFGCTFNLQADRITKQWDSKGNVITYSSTGMDDCTITDWNTIGLFYNNRCGAIVNNANPAVEIYDNDCFYGIIGNGVNVAGIRSNRTLEVRENNNTGAIDRNNAPQGIYSNSGGNIQDNDCYSIDNNSLLGEISNNRVNGSISNNSNVGDIRNNGCNGHIRFNSGECTIFKNSNNGNIDNNTTSGDIQFNSNNGSISLNECGLIEFNVNAGDISRNAAGVGSIHHNSNAGEITDNTNAGEICYNTNAGRIINNSCFHKIGFNSNGGEISNNIAASIWNNANTTSIENCNIGSGYISNNRNNGSISVTSSSEFSVYDNYNNGDIQGALYEDVFDVRINKP